ncbi:hypothetical protein CPLU01_07361 [Colletotrichum plurivorum]|uniref:Uncharacterized protein n=1 Tax=Colletotrichum plurivorum TaxID=2175906 RepID=A0A8H6NF88_9PEZI|nr:hypothetical protein CPLU01_07361 [Colletotrichum plurivorum]
MSFPDRNTFVPATAPAKRGPHPLKLDIPRNRNRVAEFKDMVYAPKLSLSAAVEVLSKQPLPEFEPYSVDLAENSHAAVERSGDVGSHDYLHWKMFHGCRPAFHWDMCPCEPVIYEERGYDRDEDYERRRSISRDIDLSSLYVPTTAEINSVLLEDGHRPTSLVVPSASQGNGASASQAQGEDLRFPAPQMSNNPADLNPEAPSFRMPKPDASSFRTLNPVAPSFEMPGALPDPQLYEMSGALPDPEVFEMPGAFPDPQSQLNDHDGEDAQPTLRGGGGSSYAPTESSRAGSEGPQQRQKNKRTCLCPWPGSAWRSVMGAWQ